MDTDLDIDALRTSFREVLHAECSIETVITHGERGEGALRVLWETIASLGWPALGVPEAHGGLGLGLAALVPLYEELGRAVAPLPFLPTMLAAQLLGEIGSDGQQVEWLGRIAAGAIVAVSPPAPLEPPTLRLTSEAGTLRLSGETTVLDAADAEAAILLAADGDGRPCRIIADVEGVGRQRLWDRGHSLSTLSFYSTAIDPAQVIASDADAEERLAIHAALALAAEAVGGSERVLARTIDYLGTREQFGRPIGSFQALKHRVADHRTRTVGDRLLLRSATALAVAGDPRAGSEVSAAKAMGCANYAEVARDCLQLHGGIGFTAEQASHLFLKRARFIELLFGDRDRHLARAATALDLAIAA